MFVVYYSKGKTHGYVHKHDGMNDFLSNPSRASHYRSAEDARASGLVGHHRDMGGDGIRGQVMSLRYAVDCYQAQQRRRSIW